MPFSFRTAIVIAAFCASTLAMTGAPGLAIVPDSIPAAPTTDLLVSKPTEAETVPTPVDSDPKVDVSTPDSPDFSSLADAVAAQQHTDKVDDELTCMASTIYFEAKGEPLAGQLAVAQVVLNRTRSGRFPKSICSVVTQRGQFSFVRGGRVPSISATNPAYRRALSVARVAMNRLWDGKAADALYFHASRVAPGWRMTRVASIGNHVFYR